jgi:Zn-dependent peptidase ImmA (M78 family)
MLNIPEKVKIGWRSYTVTQGEHKTGSNGGDLYGQIEYEKRQIFIYAKIDDDEKSVTLLHEIAHGILFNMGSELRTDENFITAFSENLYQVIKDNPSLFKD